MRQRLRSEQAQLSRSFTLFLSFFLSFLLRSVAAALSVRIAFSFSLYHTHTHTLSLPPSLFTKRLFFFRSLLLLSTCFSSAVFPLPLPFSPPPSPRAAMAVTTLVSQRTLVVATTLAFVAGICAYLSHDIGTSPLSLVHSHTDMNASIRARARTHTHAHMI